jgi:D-lyxose ketol-isomerase
MITREEQRRAVAAANELFHRAGLVVREDEQRLIEVADFGLSNLQSEGAQILTLVQTARLGVKLLALTPRQTLPEHWHPPVGDDPGKEETVRHLYGDICIYVTGPDTMRNGFIPEGRDAVYTLRHELTPQPGDQLTFSPGEKHWFQAGPRGAVLYSFSTVARDILDKFTDPAVQRKTVIADKE